MKTRMFGRSGFEVTEVGFGAWAIGSKSYGSVEEKDAVAALDAYVEGGGNFIDTARGYAVSEEIIGRWLKTNGGRDGLVLSSKVWKTDPAEMRADFEVSLKNLGVDVIDVYHLHNPPDDDDAMNRCFDVLDELREQGKIKATAASLKGAGVTRETQEIIRKYILSGRCDIIQVIFSALRQRNRDVFALAKAHGVGLIARTVLESGFLTGKYKPGHQFPEGDHRARWNGEQLDNLLREVEQIADLAVKPPFKDIMQVALRYVLDEPDVSTVIVGAKNAEQTRKNLAVADLPPLPAHVRNTLARMYYDAADIVNLPG